MKKILLWLLGIVVCLVVIAGTALFFLKEAVEVIDETIQEVDSAVKELDDVDNYKVFVEDEVRFILASADPKYAYMDLDNHEMQSKTDIKIEHIASEIDDIDQPSYKIALTKVSQSNNSFEREYASGLLKLYNNAKVNLSDFEKDEYDSNKYHFMEKNSRIRFTLSVGFICICDADFYDVDRYTNYLETGSFEAAPDVDDEEDLGRGDFCEDVY